MEATTILTRGGMLSRLGLAHVQLLTKQAGAEDAYRREMGRLIPGRNTWEDEVLEDIERLEKRFGAEAFAKVRTLMATKSSFKHVRSTTAELSRLKKWPEAVAAQQQVIEYLQALPDKNQRRLERLPLEYSVLCWRQLLARQTAAALQSCERSHGLGAKTGAALLNRAHALLLTGQTSEALSLYREGRGTKVGDAAFEAEAADDFSALEAEGVQHPEIPRIRALLGAHANFMKSFEASRAAKTWQDRVDTMVGVVNYLRFLPAEDQLRQYVPRELRILAESQVMTRNYIAALGTADEFLRLVEPPKDLEIQSIRAHALLLLDRTPEAEQIYSRYRGADVSKDRKWEAVVLDEIGNMERIGISHPSFARIKALMGAKPS
jgi:hypothetical protein